jgi:rhamnosyl/mannosyltransferase
LCYYKGLHVAIEAMKRVNGTLVIVGSGPLENQLGRQIRESDLQDRVVMVGSTSDSLLSGYLHACELLILPSTHRSEAFGLVMLQAQAAGRPVVCSDLPGLSTVNPHMRTGLVVHPDDPDALAEGINRLLADGELRQKLGSAGRSQVERLYGADLMRTRIEEVYDQLPHPRGS